jgi:peptidoglycan/LPS O-acetylase OafA/YrhL
MKKHVPAFDGVRGAAIIGVLLYHFAVVSYSGKGAMLALVGVGVNASWVGVDLFFVLSGFLITGILLDTMGDEGYFRKFYIRRALRIFPLYYGVMLVLLAATRLMHLRWNGTLQYLLLYGQNYIFERLIIGGDSQVHLMHTWSLAVEEQFYLVWPMVVLLARTRRRLRLILMVTIFACLGLRCISLWAGVSRYTVYFWTPFRVDTLAWGALACVLLRELNADRMFREARLLAAGGVAGVLAIALLRGGFDFVDPVVQTAGYTLVGGLFAGLLLLVYQQRYGLDRVASLPVLRWFGRYSYGIYIFHALTLEMLSGPRVWATRVTHSAALGALVQIVIGFSVSCGTAFLSYRYFESYWLRMKDTLAQRPKLALVPHKLKTVGRDLSLRIGRS